jgi:metal-responsive CopG/Arc/MetJ family transcriptional regulator
MDGCVRTTVSLPADIYNRAEKLRMEDGRSRGEFYAAALEEYFRLLSTGLKVFRVC